MLTFQQNENVQYEYLDWEDGTFAWIKFCKRSKFVPAIILPTDDDEIEIARWITLKGTTSIKSHSFFKASNDINERLKDPNYQKALREFCGKNKSFIVKEL